LDRVAEDDQQHEVKRDRRRGLRRQSLRLTTNTKRYSATARKTMSMAQVNTVIGLRSGAT
jgi:hypothetical protein